jgi:predicted nucleic acid-binding protein
MVVVSDTSPISNLAIVGQLELLRTVFSRIIIPQAVFDELQRSPVTIEFGNWIEVAEATNIRLVATLRSELDLGESQAIALAIERRADWLLIDEKKGRQVAIELSLPIIGLLGVLLRAKHEGFIDTLKPIMDDLREKANFRIARNVYEHVLELAGE